MRKFIKEVKKQSMPSAELTKRTPSNCFLAILPNGLFFSESSQPAQDVVEK